MDDRCVPRPVVRLPAREQRPMGPPQRPVRCVVPRLAGGVLLAVSQSRACTCQATRDSQRPSGIGRNRSDRGRLPSRLWRCDGLKSDAPCAASSPAGSRRQGNLGYDRACPQRRLADFEQVIPLRPALSGPERQDGRSGADEGLTASRASTLDRRRMREQRAGGSALISSMEGCSSSRGRSRLPARSKPDEKRAEARASALPS